MTLVYGTVKDVSDRPVHGALVSISLPFGAATGDTIFATRRAVRTNREGYWEVELTPNEELTPEGTYYVVRFLGVRAIIEVPESDVPQPIGSLILPVPQNPLTAATYVNDIEGFHGSVTADILEGILELEGGSGGGAVASVDGRTGEVTLDDLYAAIDHVHEGGGSGAVNSVDGRQGDVTLDDLYSDVSHDHDADYAPLEHGHPEIEEMIEDLDEAYSPLGHDHSGVYSPVSHNHDGTYSPTSHTHAQYVTSSHTHDDRYVQLGDESVESVDGQTGEVDLSETYSPLSHNHNAAYSAISHLHDDRYSQLGHTHEGGGGGAVDSVDGRSGTVTLGDLYSSISHDHDDDYAPTVHTHGGTYVEIGQETVTSVEGRTGDIELDDLFAGASHDHSGVYSPVAHNHDGTYATTAHNHDAAYAALAHGHEMLEVITFSHQGDLTTGTGTFRKYPLFPGEIVAVVLSVGTAPTGSAITVDVNKDTTTIFTTQANRPSISASQFVTTSGAVQNGTFDVGNYIRVDIDAVGSSVAGADLLVEIYYKRTLLV